ncbi:hypothetical protein [Chromobacterium violaceum]|uniref:hypothetical protein n=1 Tax=Chromobacterium violaceum TaxID=536 RepID=UPI0012D4249C|nr:hypothetical protein [Chromobacterium violaceum]
MQQQTATHNRLLVAGIASPTEPRYLAARRPWLQSSMAMPGKWHVSSNLKFHKKRPDRHHSDSNKAILTAYFLCASIFEFSLDISGG